MELIEKEEKQQEKEQKQLLIDKKENYARYVKEMHFPHRSPRKIKELDRLVTTLHHPVKSQMKFSPGYKVEVE